MHACAPGVTDEACQAGHYPYPYTRARKRLPILWPPRVAWRGVQVTGSAFERLAACLPALTTLDLSRTRLNNQGLAHVRDGRGLAWPGPFMHCTAWHCAGPDLAPALAHSTLPSAHRPRHAARNMLLLPPCNACGMYHTV